MGTDRRTVQEPSREASVGDGNITELHVALVAPLIPQNTGAIGRLCVALGAYLHLIEPLGFRLTDRRLKRAGLDYWPHLRIMRHATWEEFLRSVHPSDLFFFSVRGHRSLFECRFMPGSVLVFGNEVEGLPQSLWSRYDERTVRIPMPGQGSRSLNLAMAVAVAAYEAHRQLTVQGSSCHAEPFGASPEQSPP